VSTGSAWEIAIAALLIAAAASGCAAPLQTRAAGANPVREFTAQVALHDETLTLHLASPAPAATQSGPLVLYASGDGGWFGAAVGMFRTIAATGRPTVGFSTKSFMHIEQQSVRPLTVADIVEDYQRIIATARESLQLPSDTPVVITGWSRGASLGVLVASWRAPQVVGLVAIGLAASERLDIEAGSDDDPVPGAPAAADERASRSRAMYPLLARIAPRRSVVIQASGDGYLPAADARALFGSDSTASRLVAIDARNHRFGGGESAFAAALVDAVTWVSSTEEQQR
jgi:pimeloyl-ACP methyl ester carboxylesterase